MAPGEEIELLDREIAELRRIGVRGGQALLEAKEAARDALQEALAQGKPLATKLRALEQKRAGLEREERAKTKLLDMAERKLEEVRKDADDLRRTLAELTERKDRLGHEISAVCSQAQSAGPRPEPATSASLLSEVAAGLEAAILRSQGGPPTVQPLVELLARVRGGLPRQAQPCDRPAAAGPEPRAHDGTESMDTSGDEDAVHSQWIDRMLSQAMEAEGPQQLMSAEQKARVIRHVAQAAATGSPCKRARAANGSALGARTEADGSEVSSGSPAREPCSPRV